MRLFLLAAGLILLAASCSQAPSEQEAKLSPPAEVIPEIDPDSELAQAFTAAPDTAPSAPLASPPKSSAMVLLPVEPPPASAAPPVVNTIPLGPEPEPAPIDPTEKLGELRDGLLHLKFDELTNYKVEMPNPFIDEEEQNLPPLDDQIPPNVKALNNTKITIEGHCFPIEVKDGKATSYLLLNAPLACCFAELPGMNEWIYVEQSPGAEFSPTHSTVVTGAFEVGSKEIADGAATTLYRLQATASELKELAEPLTTIGPDPEHTQNHDPEANP